MWDLRVFPQDDSVSPGNLFETVMTDHPAILLLRCVLDQDLDRALTLGLMEYVPALGDAMLDPRYPDLPAQLLAAQRRLRQAWAARDRYRARAVRLQRVAAALEMRRATSSAHSSSTGTSSVLPPLAAEILKRAKAKAAGRQDI
ncbi:hypothetical protein D1605_008150 [Xylella fastidiosa subsp. fastidiosa]|uniref:Uncharacterized protein n=3 Tax=Xylella fastidiosa TaxID=2371 RepID=Q87BD2_XYLFT|nr:conserved hypothetical protein [Xylella fastidiosa Temecula1]ACB93019.1 hypothetical protein XfasM23_1611 [Xylella fastidiosa M23]ADN62370.1 hypothetical protein XFLM_01835 [Xylella fastidiosa subsp. fastidiosa GB514]KAF0571956.1 hypothetical protein P305_02480 [Xylella fastidiosa subsp. fastidiosa Mus-1]MBE0262241.1 hypothetical protein [Xylella fastidiosa subsp. fastidiosa]NMR00684.1 hypothetical protein [Xylella fastidiosa]